jgi:hypothetical protein
MTPKKSLHWCFMIHHDMTFLPEWHVWSNSFWFGTKWFFFFSFLLSLSSNSAPDLLNLYSNPSIRFFFVIFSLFPLDWNFFYLNYFLELKFVVNFILFNFFNLLDLILILLITIYFMWDYFYFIFLAISSFIFYCYVFFYLGKFLKIDIYIYIIFDFIL